MLRYSFGEEYLESRPASEEEKQHVLGILLIAEKRFSRLRMALIACGGGFLSGFVLMFAASNSPAGLLTTMVSLLAMGRFALEYRDAKKPLPLLRESANLTELALYGMSFDPHSSALHPTTHLVVRKGGKLVHAAIRIEGVDDREVPKHPEAGYFSSTRASERKYDSRPLSEAEVAELNNLRGFAPWKAGCWILIAAWICVGGILSPLDAKNALPPLGIGLCSAGLLAIGFLLIRWNMPALQLMRDRRVKRVIRVDHDGTRIEFLPYSHIIWTTEDEPSEVRRGHSGTAYEIPRYRR